MTTLTFTGVSQAQVDNLINKLTTTHKATVTSTVADSYNIEGHGATIKATYDTKQEILTAVVENHPFYVTMESIESGITNGLVLPSSKDVKTVA
jgi:hypothetical protein